VVEELDFISNPKSQNKELFYTFMAELDQLSDTSKVLVIATTNKLEDISKNLRRGGRLDIDIRFDMPSAEDRHEVLKSHFQQIENDFQD